MKKISISIGVALALAGALLMPSSVGFAEEVALYVPDTDLGSGLSAYTEQELLNAGAKDTCLDAIRAVRQDALNDTSVKWEDKSSGKSMRQFLADNHISEAEYLAPRWSSKLEQIAIVRAAESAVHGKIAHSRLNGDSVFSISVDGVGPSEEGISWGPSTCAGAVKLWASEKKNWVGNTGGVTGHYTSLINPSLKQYGLGGIAAGPNNAAPYGNLWLLSAAGQVDDDESAFNMSGRFAIPVNVPKSALDSGIEVDPIDWTVENYYPFHAKLTGYSGRVFLDGQWLTDDIMIAAPQKDGSILTMGVGTTNLSFVLHPKGKPVFTTRVTVHDVGVAPTPGLNPNPVPDPELPAVQRAVAPAARGFVAKDVPVKSMFAGEIQWMMKNNYSTGWNDGTYRPLNSVNRDAMAAFLYRLAGKPAVDLKGPRFRDVPSNNLFFKEITWMKSTGISKGWFDNTFRPLEPVSREAMAAFLYRFCKQMPDRCAAAVNPGSLAVSSDVKFRDVPIYHQFAEPIGWLAAAKISTGWNDGTFRPGEPIHRDAMAAFLYRLKNNYLVH